MRHQLSQFLVIATMLASTFAPATAQAAFEFYSVDASGSTTEKTVYNFNEKPYVYVFVPFVDTPKIISTFWNAPDTAVYFEQQGPETGGTQAWFGLEDWETKRQTGEWNVTGNAFFANGESLTGKANFVVTPEPTTTALFVTGAAAAALTRRRKKKKA